MNNTEKYRITVHLMNNLGMLEFVSTDDLSAILKRTAGYGKDGVGQLTDYCHTFYPPHQINYVTVEPVESEE